MADVGKAWQNGYAERSGALWAYAQKKEIALSDYLTLADAHLSIGHFIEQVYQAKRIGCPLGAALGYLTPVEFEIVWQQQQTGSGTSLNLP